MKREEHARDSKEDIPKKKKKKIMILMMAAED